jgi:zinc protease
MRLLPVLFALLFAAPSFALDIRSLPVEGSRHGAFYVHDAHAPIVAMQMAFPGAGYAYEPKEAAGVAALTAEMLEDGAGVMPPEEFRRFMDRSHAAFSVSFDADAIYVRITAIGDRLPPVLEKAVAVLSAPAYGKADLRRYVNAQETRIKEREETPSYVATEALGRLVYGDHPYSLPELGTPQSVRALTAEAADSFHEAAFVPEKARFAFAGDISAEDAQTLAGSVVAALKAAKRDAPLPLPERLPEAEYLVKKYVRVHIERDVPQAAVVFALPAPTRTHGNFFDYYVADYMLGGGGFESYLMNELREKRGLAYGLDTSIAYGVSGAALVGRSSTSAASLEEFVARLAEEIDRGTVPEKRLDTAKSYLLHSFSLSLAKNGDIASMLTGLAVYGMGTDYLSYREAKINQVTEERLAPIFRDAWRKNRLAVVSVGRGKAKPFLNH